MKLLASPLNGLAFCFIGKCFPHLLFGAIVPISGYVSLSAIWTEHRLVLKIEASCNLSEVVQIQLGV